MPRQVGRRGKLSAPVLVKLSSLQRQELEAAAMVHQCSEPELVRRALDEFLNRVRPQLRPVLSSVQKARQRIAGE
jgi:hypothetical protein